MNTSNTQLRESPQHITGVNNPLRLRVVEESQLSGHMGDQDLDAIVSTLVLACKVPMAIVNVVRPDLQTYPSELGVGQPFTQIADQESFCTQIVETAHALVVSDASTDPLYSKNPLVRARTIMAYAGEPLIEDGTVIGSVAILDTTSRIFTETELAVLRHQARLAQAVLELRHSARTDYLTGLPNRRVFFDRLTLALSRLQRSDECVGVLFVDVDGFKRFNDQFGHAAGDYLLQKLSAYLLTSLRPMDTLARLGGDEFAILCEGLKSHSQAEEVAARIVAHLNSLDDPIAGLVLMNERTPQMYVMLVVGRLVGHRIFLAALVARG